MSDHVALWRAAGHWKSNFRDEDVSPNKRLKNDFFYDIDGNPTEDYQRYLDDTERTTEHFVEYFLPNMVQFPTNRPGSQRKLPEDWLADQCSGVWFYFVKGQNQYVFFEDKNDAFGFKMFWG